MQVTRLRLPTLNYSIKLLVIGMRYINEKQSSRQNEK